MSVGKAHGRQELSDTVPGDGSPCYFLLFIPATSTSAVAGPLDVRPICTRPDMTLPCSETYYNTTSSYLLTAVPTILIGDAQTVGGVQAAKSPYGANTAAIGA